MIKKPKKLGERTKMNKFLGYKLKAAMQFRGMGISDLARKVGLSKQLLSLYANDDNTPPYENVNKLAQALDFPYEFFVIEDRCTTITDNTYFRSQASASKKSRKSQRIKLEYVAKIYEILLNYLDFPAIDIPKVDSANIDSSSMDSDDIFGAIENIADEVRKQWNLGRTPIKDFQFLLEKHGFIVTGFGLNYNKIDAFSQRIRIYKGTYLYIIALALGQKSLQRLRFDMAHELGHVLLHPWEEETDALSKAEFNERERQANMFASALLLPKDSFEADVSAYPTSLEYYQFLKKKWNVSIQAMLYRARQLNIITANQFQYLMRQISKNGWRLREPGDIPGTMNETIFQGAIDMLFQEGYFNQSSLLRKFSEYGIAMRVHDLNDLLQLREGMFDPEPEIYIKPKLIKSIK